MTVPSPETNVGLSLGIQENLTQFVHQLIQVLLVGFALGMMRTVVPALAETEFGVSKGSFMLLTAFVVAFGVVKGVLNFVAGRLSERIGRKRVLLLGWLVAIPVMIYPAPSWIVAATVLLGVNQGLCWSMTQTSKLDFTRADQRGLTLGLNEFAGYVGVALAGGSSRPMQQALGGRGCRQSECYKVDQTQPQAMSFANILEQNSEYAIGSRMNIEGDWIQHKKIERGREGGSRRHADALR